MSTVAPSLNQIIRMCWLAGYDIRDAQRLEQFRRSVELAIQEGFDAEQPEEMDNSYAMMEEE